MIVEGRKVSESLQFYTINILLLGTMTHEQFVEEFPDTSKILERITKKQKKLEMVLSEVE